MTTSLAVMITLKILSTKLLEPDADQFTAVMTQAERSLADNMGRAAKLIFKKCRNSPPKFEKWRGNLRENGGEFKKKAANFYSLKTTLNKLIW